MTQISQDEPTVSSPVSGAEAKPFMPPAKRAPIAAGMNTLIFGAIGLLVTALLLAVVFSHKLDPKAHKQSPAAIKAQAQQQQATNAAQSGKVMPDDKNNLLNAAPDTDSDNISPSDVLNTKNAVEAERRHAAEQVDWARKAPEQGTAATGAQQGANQPSTGSSSKAIGNIAAFHPPPFNAGAPGTSTTQPQSSTAGQGAQNAASYSEAMHAWQEEVTKPRLLFSRRTASPVADATQYLGPAITNFGLETGFHVAARLEASASTAVAAPVTAVVEYNYERDGQIVLPAGSRAIGRIESADIHGNMSIIFDSVDLPNGATVPIKAVAVDTNLRELKGRVTGNNRALAMVVATMSGIGQTTAMMLGNNTNSALSQNNVMRSQLATNMGQTSDTQIRAMLANQKIIVTLAAGTEIYMVFTKPALPSQETSSATNLSHPQPALPPSGR
jgi:hypothetical protein